MKKHKKTSLKVKLADAKKSVSIKVTNNWESLDPALQAKHLNKRIGKGKWESHALVPKKAPKGSKAARAKAKKKAEQAEPVAAPVATADTSGATA